jgi:putative ABC transport system permease protein
MSPYEFHRVMKIPLAWKNLVHDRRRLLIALSGISFAVILMFQQRGFNNALFDSTVAILEQTQADIIILDQGRFSVSSETRFDRKLLDIAASTPGVKQTDPIYIENSLAFLRTQGRKAQPIRVIGFDLNRPIFIDADGQPLDVSALLKTPRAALIDTLSKQSYGLDLAPEYGEVQHAELASKSISIVGTFQLGRDFANDGNLIVSQESIAHYFPYRKPGDPLAVVDMGLVHCQAGADIQQVKQRLKSKLAGQKITVETRGEFIDREKRFWANATPIGTIFLIGAVIGFVVGVIICYQILATNISDHIREFATLKAMGYTNSYFVRLVIVESIYLSLIGFIPGLLISIVLFNLIAQITGLIMIMTIWRALFILLLTLLMCIVSGLLALRKLISTDPAELF